MTTRETKPETVEEHLASLWPGEGSEIDAATWRCMLGLKQYPPVTQKAQHSRICPVPNLSMTACRLTIN